MKSFLKFRSLSSDLRSNAIGKLQVLQGKKVKVEMHPFQANFLTGRASCWTETVRLLCREKSVNN